MNRYEKENAKLVMGMKILAAIIISLSVAKCAVKKVNTSSNKHITNKKEMHKGLMYGRKVSSLKQHKNTQSEVIQQPKVDGLTGKPLPEKVKKAASVRKVVKKEAPVRKVVKKAAPVRKAVKKAAPVRKAVKKAAPVRKAVKKAAPVRKGVKKAASVRKVVKKAAPVRKAVKKAAPVRKIVKKVAPVRKAVKKAAPVRKAVKRHKHKKPYRRTKAKDPKKDWRLRHMYGNTKTW
jgi:hypothetical protein